MSNDLISRSVLKRAVAQAVDHKIKWTMESNVWQFSVDEILSLIDKAPAVMTEQEFPPTSTDDCNFPNEVVKYMVSVDNAEPKPAPTGEWLVHNGGTTHYFYCSECHAAGDLWDPYCRNCGAIMNASKNNK